MFLFPLRLFIWTQGPVRTIWPTWSFYNKGNLIWRITLVIKESRSPGDSEAPRYEQQWEASCTPTAVGMTRMSVEWDTKVAWWRLVPSWRCSHCHRRLRKEREMEGNTLISSLLLSPVFLLIPPVGQIYLETREQGSLGSVDSVIQSMGKDWEWI